VSAVYPTAERMLVALAGAPPPERLDVLALVNKVYIEQPEWLAVLLERDAGYGWRRQDVKAAAIEAALRDLLAACRHDSGGLGPRVLDAMERAERALSAPST